jgi:hypothetical protein
MKNAVVSLMYEKLLTLNEYSARKANIGKLFNVISADFNSIEMGIIFPFLLICLPFLLLFSFVIMYSNLGPIGLISIFLLVLLIPL